MQWMWEAADAVAALVDAVDEGAADVGAADAVAASADAVDVGAADADADQDVEP